MTTSPLLRPAAVGLLLTALTLAVLALVDPGPTCPQFPDRDSCLVPGGGITLDGYVFGAIVAFLVGVVAERLVSRSRRGAVSAVES